jgi:LuxR family transcriptional regulator, regulator of acetate metabolism
VTVRGRVRAVLYASVRGGATLGERAADRLVDIARQLGAELALRDEVDRRVKLIAADYAEHQAGVLNADAREELRDLQGELRRIAQAVDDPGLRDQLRAASERLAGLGQPRVLDAAAGAQAVGPGAVGPGAVGPQLSPRELDVLAQVALGCGNAEIARRLSLRPETVKAYLRSATGKLEVHNRNEAVVTARRLGLLALPSQARLVAPAPPQPLNGHFAPYRARAEGEQTFLLTLVRG